MREIEQITKFQKVFLIATVGILLQSGCINPVAKSPRERISINCDWRFTEDDPNEGFTDNLEYPVNRSNPGARRGFGGRGGRGEPEMILSIILKSVIHGHQATSEVTFPMLAIILTIPGGKRLICLRIMQSKVLSQDQVEAEWVDYHLPEYHGIVRT